MPLKCCLCLSQIHLECIDIPISLVLQGAYYHELEKDDMETVVEAFKRFKAIDLSKGFSEALDLRDKVL